MTLKITVSADCLTMDRDCDDERYIYKNYGLEEDKLRNKSQCYEQDFQYQDRLHFATVSWDQNGTYSPTLFIGGLYGHELLGYLDPIVCNRAQDSATIKENVDKFQKKMDTLEPEVQAVCKNIIQTVIRILNDNPNLTPDHRNCLSDGRAVMQQLENNFDTQRNRQFDHRWIFTDIDEEILFKANTAS